MSSGILKVKETQVVDSNGTPVILRGAAIGGWLKYILTIPYALQRTDSPLQYGELHHRLPGPRVQHPCCYA